MKHYIGMAGLHGCLPNYCEVYDSARDAAVSLADIHDLGQKRRAALIRDGHIELSLARDGNRRSEHLQERS